MDSKKPRPIRPQMSLMALLAITFFAALIAMVIRFTGVVSLIVLVIFAPTVVGSFCGVLDWPSGRYALNVIKALLITIAAGVVGAFLAVGFLTGTDAWLGFVACLAVFCFLVWPVQYTVIVGLYE